MLHSQSLQRSPSCRGPIAPAIASQRPAVPQPVRFGVVVMSGWRPSSTPTQPDPRLGHPTGSCCRDDRLSQGLMVHSYRLNGGMRFSIRPLLVKGFALSTPVLLQSDAFRRASLLSGIGPSALPLWDAWDEAAQSMGRSDRAPAAGTSASTSSPDPPSCEGRLSSARWRNSGYLTVSDECAR